MICADDARIACPLFQAEYGGEVPTSALQLRLLCCSEKTFRELNYSWHSRLPNAGEFYGAGLFFTAEFSNKYYATAGWSAPINIAFNDCNFLELRRFAIAKSAPKNTASRLLSLMVRYIKKNKPHIVKLISYQDTAVHTGTIYKAQGWKQEAKASTRCGWLTHKRRGNTGGPSFQLQSDTPKLRWELLTR